MYTLYILQSTKARRLYIGITENIERRLAEHNALEVRSTKAYAPYILLKTERFVSKTEARKRELQLKKSGVLRKLLKQGLSDTPPSSSLA